MKEKESQRIIFLEGKKVILRPPRKDTDLEIVTKWFNDQDIIQYTHFYLPQSLTQEEEWFDGLSKIKDDVVLAVETLDGVFIGIAGLHSICPKDRSATHGIVLGDKNYWGKGYGTDVGMTLLNYAFNTLNLRKVNSSVIGFNKRSLNYHLKCGYQVVGKQRKEIFKNGRYYDLILLDVFRKEWLPCWKKYQKQ